MLFTTLAAAVSAYSIKKSPVVPEDRLSGIIYKSQFNPTVQEAAASKIAYTIGNPVLLNQVNIYYLYYGNFTQAQKTVLEDFAQNVGKSAWYKTTTQYYFQASKSAKKEYVSNNVALAGTSDDDYSKGNSLRGNDLPDLIQEHIDDGRLPEDTNGIYFVLTSGGVDESIRDDLGYASFCYDYCGYHVSWELKSGNRIYYSQVGNPTACLDGCAAPSNQNGSPNGDIGIDAMISVLAHELTEAVTDPESDGRRAWEDKVGYENADKCAWTYGPSTKGESGYYNTQVGNRKYLIQQNWSPVSQSCVMTV